MVVLSCNARDFPTARRSHWYTGSNKGASFCPPSQIISRIDIGIGCSCIYRLQREYEDIFATCVVASIGQESLLEVRTYAVNACADSHVPAGRCCRVLLSGGLLGIRWAFQVKCASFRSSKHLFALTRTQHARNACFFIGWPTTLATYLNNHAEFHSKLT